MAVLGRGTCAGPCSESGGQNERHTTDSFRKPITRRIEGRPRSTKLFTHVHPRSMHLPSYTEDYGPKPLVHTQCVRSGTSSGNRRNNPHPGEGFMVWRLPSRLPSLVEEEGVRGSTASLHPNQLIAQQQLKSTYQDDFTGMQQQGERPSDSAKPGKSALPQLTYSLASSMRHTYQPPRLSSNLKGNTTRYGCSVDIVKPACGVVPMLHPHPLPACYQTWYTNEFGGSRGRGGRAPTPRPGPRAKVPQPVCLPPINGHKPLSVASSSSKGSEAGSRSSKRQGGRKVKTREGKQACSHQAVPIWLSEWTGPM